MTIKCKECWIVHVSFVYARMTYYHSSFTDRGGETQDGQGNKTYEIACNF
jgi:hypothetical protein